MRGTVLFGVDERQVFSRVSATRIVERLGHDSRRECRDEGLCVAQRSQRGAARVVRIESPTGVSAQTTFNPDLVLSHLRTVIDAESSL